MRSNKTTHNAYHICQCLDTVKSSSSARESNHNWKFHTVPYWVAGRPRLAAGGGWAGEEALPPCQAAAQANGLRGNPIQLRAWLQINWVPSLAGAGFQVTK